MNISNELLRNNSDITLLKLKNDDNIDNKNTIFDMYFKMEIVSVLTTSKG